MILILPQALEASRTKLADRTVLIALLVDTPLTTNLLNARHAPWFEHVCCLFGSLSLSFRVSLSLLARASRVWRVRLDRTLPSMARPIVSLAMLYACLCPLF